MRRTFALIACLCLAADAVAQPVEMKFDASGRWTPVEAAAPSPDQAVMDKARTYLAEDKPTYAKSLLNTWIDKNEFSESSYLAEAYLLRADAKTAAGSEYRALYDYEVVCKDFPATREFVKAVERELEIGIRYVNGYKRKFLGMRITNAEDVGEELLVRTTERMPGSRLGERALIELVDYYYRDRDLKMTQVACQKFVELYPRSSLVTHAKQQRIFASVGLFKGPNYDASGLVDAKVLIEDYVKEDPIGAQRVDLSDALLAKIDESLAAQKLERARYYLKRGDPVSARASLRRVCADHPKSVAATTAMQIMESKKWALPPKPIGMPEATSQPAAAPQEPKP